MEKNVLKSVVCSICAIALSVVCFAQVGSAATVVFDNSLNVVQPDPTWTPKGFLEFSRFLPYELQGDEVRLEGTDRNIVQFDIVLMSQGEVTLTDLHVGFYLNDGDDGYDDKLPGTALWSTTLSNVTLPGGLFILSVPIDGVEVPDQFTWLVAADSMDAGLVPCSFPAPGQNIMNSLGNDYYWDYTPAPYDFWTRSDFGGRVPAELGAKFVAVPEPATILLLAAGFLVVGRKKKEPTASSALCATRS